MRKLWITLPLLFFGYVGNVEANDDEIHCLAENIYWEARSESTAGKVALTALEIDGGSDIGADLTTSDLIIVDDGAGGTNRKAALSRLTTFMTGQGFSTDDPTALAIALG